MVLDSESHIYGLSLEEIFKGRDYLSGMPQLGCWAFVWKDYIDTLLESKSLAISPALNIKHWVKLKQYSINTPGFKNGTENTYYYSAEDLLIRLN